MSRVEFSPPTRRAIVHRATKAGVAYCEECGASCPTPDHYQIDHILAEAMRRDGRRLTAADGRLLCLECHKAKTRRDLYGIAKGARLGRKYRRVAQADGRTQIARRYGVEQKEPGDEA